MGKEVEGGYGAGMASFVLRIFSLLAGGNLRGVSREVSVDYSLVVQVRPFMVVVSTDWSGTEQRVTSHHSWSWPHPPGFAAFLGLELKYN